MNAWSVRRRQMECCAISEEYAWKNARATGVLFVSTGFLDVFAHVHCRSMVIRRDWCLPIYACVVSPHSRYWVPLLVGRNVHLAISNPPNVRHFRRTHPSSKSLQKSIQPAIERRYESLASSQQVRTTRHHHRARVYIETPSNIHGWSHRFRGSLTLVVFSAKRRDDLRKRGEGVRQSKLVILSRAAEKQ